MSENTERYFIVTWNANFEDGSPTITGDGGFKTSGDFVCRQRIIVSILKEMRERVAHRKVNNVGIANIIEVSQKDYADYHIFP